MMDSKKVGKLRSLRLKMPHLRRNKASSSKPPTQLERNLEHQMSISVPDISSMREEYNRVSSNKHLQEYNPPKFNGNSRMPDKPAASSAKGRSGLLEVPDGGDKKSYHRLSMPMDYTDWAFSQESLNGHCGEENIYLETLPRPLQRMEHEELAVPEITTVSSPNISTEDVSTDNTQVQNLTSFIKTKTELPSKNKQGPA